MTLGAEPKKVAILLAVVVFGAIWFFVNQNGDTAPASDVRPVSTSAPAAAPATAGNSAGSARMGGGRAAVSEFHPRLGSARPEDRVDPASIDPELRLDLLAKVQAVEPVSAGRNLFQFGAAAPPDKPLPAVPANVPKIAISSPPPRQTQTASAPAAPTGPAAPPPINLRYYGYKITKSDGQKQAFLMDGDEILSAEENQIIKRRYRIVKIAVTSIVVEDTQSKSTQTLTLQDIPG